MRLRKNVFRLERRPDLHPQTPVADGTSIIPSPPGSHFGGPSMVMTGNQDQTYGPIFNYFNKGSNIGTLRGDADKYAAANATGTYDLNSFYDSLSLPYYATAAQRGTVSVNIRIADGQSMTGATVILSTFDPAAYATSPISQEYQRRAKGYNYWISANPDGTFSIPDVRPGTYRVTVIKPGNYREGTYDNITVTGGATTNVGRLTWQPDVGNGAWQIGTFDRTADEFRDGENHNNWIDTFNRSVEFPNGVNYTVNPSKPLNDPQNWNNNWALDQSNAGFDFWKVNFNLPAAPAANSTITLTLAVADQMFINDIGVLIGNNRVDANFDHTADNAPGVFRSGETSSAVLYRKLTIPASWLAAGNNTFSFHIVGGDMQWDALRLDIQNPGTFSMSQWDGGNGNWSDATHWATQKYNFTGVNKGQATINGVANPEYGNDTSTTFADGATNTAPINNGGSQLYYDAVLNGGVLTLDTSPTVQKLSLLNGTLSVGTANTVTANDAFVFAGGNVSGTGSINALSTTTINFDNTISSGFKVISTGAVTWNDGASVTITDPGSQWTTPGLSVGSGALNVGAGATFSAGAGSLNVGTLATVSSAGNVIGASITNTGTFASTGSVTLSGAFNNSGTASISGRLSATGVINNAGLLILSGQNVYTGATTISGGAVQFAGASSIGGSGQSVTVNSGGAVSFAPGITDPTFLARINPASTGALALTSADSGATLDFTGNGLAPFPNMGIGAIGTVNFAGNYTPANNIYRLGGGGGTLNFAPLISTGSVIIGNTGSSGTVTLNNANSYNGPTTIRGGILSITSLTNGSSPGAIGASGSGASNLILDGGTHQLIGISATDRLFTLSSAGGAFEAAGNASFTTAGAIGGAGALNLIGAPATAHSLLRSPGILRSPKTAAVSG